MECRRRWTPSATRMTERLICPDCKKTIIEDRVGSLILGTRCGCPDKHWGEQDRQLRERLAMEGTRYKSEGTLVYSIDERVGHKLHVEIDPGIAATYRALIPKTARAQVPRFAPHISVIRKESIPRLDLWGNHEGERIEFEYESTIFQDEIYFWLRCYSQRLIEIRQELGLSDLSDLARPPDLFDSFHTTIANKKSAGVK